MAAALRRIRALPWLVIVLSVCALVWFAAFLTVGDVDNLLLAIACVAVAFYEADYRQLARKLRRYADANGAASLELSRTAGQIHALFAERNRDKQRIANYEAIYGPIMRHDAKFAHMPRIGGKPIPVPEGHPEHRGVKP